MLSNLISWMSIYTHSNSLWGAEKGQSNYRTGMDHCVTCVMEFPLSSSQVIWASLEEDKQIYSIKSEYHVVRLDWRWVLTTIAFDVESPRSLSRQDPSQYMDTGDKTWSRLSDRDNIPVEQRWMTSLLRVGGPTWHFHAMFHSLAFHAWFLGRRAKSLHETNCCVVHP